MCFVIVVCFFVFLKPNRRDLASLVLYEYQSFEILVEDCTQCIVFD